MFTGLKFKKTKIILCFVFFIAASDVVFSDTILYQISPKTFQPGVDYSSFLNQLRKDYAKNPTSTRDFILYNTETHEAYHIGPHLFLDAIGYKKNNPTATDEDYGFIKLHDYKRYDHMAGDNVVVTLNTAQKAATLLYMNSQHDQLNIDHIVYNFRYLILAIAEAARFQHIADALNSNQVTSTWAEAYGPVAYPWPKTLRYFNFHEGDVLDINQTLEYLQSLPDQGSYYLVKKNLACPTYGGKYCE